MNSTVKVIAERYSCRAYTDVALTHEQVEALALAAVQAPSAMNLQPYRVIVITDKPFIDEMNDAAMEFLRNQENTATYDRIMARGGKLFYNAPCMIMLPIEDCSDLAPIDCGIVSQNIAIAATSMGLGSVICGLAQLPLQTDKGEEFKERMGFPDGYKFGMAVLVGNPVSAGTPHEPDMSKITYIK